MRLSQLSLRVILAGSMGLGVLACSDDPKDLRTLKIKSPTSTGGPVELCLDEDENTTTSGIQYSVQVDADHFKNGALVSLLIDGKVDKQLDKAVTDETVTWSGITFAAGSHTIQVKSQDGKIQSETIPILVNETAPAVSFISPATGDTLGMGKDTDAGTAGLQATIRVFAAVADDQEATISVIPPSGGTAPTLTPVKVKNQEATWDKVTFNKSGKWTLTANTKSECGNPGTKSIDVQVDLDADACTIEVVPTPVSRKGKLFLNKAMDTNPSAGFQARVNVVASQGSRVTLLQNGADKGSIIVGTTALANYDLTLTEGEQVFSASCRDSAGNEKTSKDPVTVHVDTQAPKCEITAPADGAILHPGLDANKDTPDTDFDITVSVDPDVNGENVSVSVGGAAITPVKEAAAGTVAYRKGLNAPGKDIEVKATSNDQAGNTCQDTIKVNHYTTGCSIAILEPTLFTSDANGTVSGVQVPVIVQVGDECKGKEVSLFCGNQPVKKAAADGNTAKASFEITSCPTIACETQVKCVAKVTSPSTIETQSLEATITTDTVAPSVIVSVVNPAISCGSSITKDQDIDPDTDGVQIKIMQDGSDAVTRSFNITTATAGTKNVAADVDRSVVLTLESGKNTIEGKATDSSGLEGKSSTCSVTLANLAVAFTKPTDNQVLGPGNDLIPGGSLDYSVCGTFSSSHDTTTVTVQLDGQPPLTAIVAVDKSFCATVNGIARGAHKLKAQARDSSNENSGEATISFSVDDQEPGVPIVVVMKSNRHSHSVELTATADDFPGVDRCVLKRSLDPIVLETFDAATTVATFEDATNDSTHTYPAPSNDLRDWYYAARCYDAVNNGSFLGTANIDMGFEKGPLLVPAPFLDANISKPRFGMSAASADLNNDTFLDLAVGYTAADIGIHTTKQNNEGAVYVFMGGADGISSTPSFVISGDAAQTKGEFGYAITRVRWNADTIDDIAVGYPGKSQVLIFFGSDTTWKPGESITAYDHTNANVVIGKDTTTDGAWYGTMGHRVERLDFDGNGKDDLLISASGGDWKGGAFVLFGGSTKPAGSGGQIGIDLPTDLSPSTGTNTKVTRFTFASITADNTFPSYGQSLANLGKLGNGTTADKEDDVAIGAEPSSSHVANNPSPEVFVFYGRPAPADPSASEEIKWGDADQRIKAASFTPVVTPDGVVATSYFGQAIASISDLDGDGKRDIAVSTALGGGDLHGIINIVPGGIKTDTQAVQDLGVAATSIVTITGTRFDEEIGAMIANSGTGLGSDVDGDGKEDLVTANAVLRGGASYTAVRVFLNASLKGNLLGSQADSVLLPTTATVKTTWALPWCGDLNKDGLMDLAWTDPRKTIGEAAGFVQVLY
ncbi:MAG: hypothetical protein HY698_18785 [Deltaproteobacteria bacterium]|nr:hypothetical protein [Deltaproteobacteria bacterium]